MVAHLNLRLTRHTNHQDLKTIEIRMALIHQEYQQEGQEVTHR